MLKVQVKGIEEVKAFLQTVRRGAKDIAQRAVTLYLIGIEDGGGFLGGVSHGLAHYVPYHYVSLEQAYGADVWKTMSAKQRGFIWASINAGKNVLTGGAFDPGVPHRTSKTQLGWEYTESGGRYRITNETPGAKYVMGDDTQTRLHQLQGWRTVSAVVQSNLAGALRHAQAKVREWLKTKGR